MMTKEEVLNTIIEHYKNGSTSALSDYCDRIKCYECLFESGDCVDEVNNMLIDRLLKAEEHQETNLEHFRLNVVFDKANGTVHINLKNGWENNYSRPHKGAVDWLLSPYEEPNQKYKLNQFEYDLLDSFVKKWGNKESDIFMNYGILEMMIDKGYFEGASHDTLIKDVLDNCEVIEE